MSRLLYILYFFVKYETCCFYSVFDVFGKYFVGSLIDKMDGFIIDLDILCLCVIS